ncbi:MAG TPA: hypothetical protein PLU71_01765 [Candidatus Dependentiae bacterium]|nr:hypothetical protein [Candidatus Dependentiae bacterium]HRQ62558.1 hypothetical protein [Candidatus Dependentiae bacterium]
MTETKELFSGNIYIFHAFDVGDDINLEAIEEKQAITTIPLSLPKYFKSYHAPIAVKVPDGSADSRCISCKIHDFGAISLTYKIPFSDTLSNLRKNLDFIDNDCHEQSMLDVKAVFNKISPYITKPKFFDVHASYVVIQVDPKPNISVTQLQEQFGGVIASMLRFETETLSEDQKNEILDAAIGYFRGDLVIIDTDASFAYDAEFEEIQNFFEFTNIQQLELKYFDSLLAQQLNRIYEKGVQKIPISSYLPLLGTLGHDPVVDLGKLKVDISAITERLEGNIKIAGEPYFSEVYELLEEKLDLRNWRNGLDRKLAIIQDIRMVYQHKTDAVREDILSLLIVILIFIELIVGLLNYLQ